MTRRTSTLDSDTGRITGNLAVPDSILDEIVASKHREVAAARLRMPLDEMEHQAAEAPPTRDFLAALSGPGPIRLIAEVKKASPSAKVIREDFEPISIARTYQDHGAACLSVLTDAPYFQGHLSYLARIRAAVALPLLRKDFIIDEYQVVEARLAGADAVLLIAEILDDARLVSLRERAQALGMAALVEFHDEANLPRVLDSGATLVGVNNRDLTRFVTDLDRTLRLRDAVPPHVTLVSESGIRCRRDVERLEAAGVSAVLVGEALMRSADIGLAVERILGLAPEPAEAP
jgi:indole-3-glycerol phosphate synthase